MNASKPATILTLGRLGYEGPSADGADRLLGQPKRFAILLYVLLMQRDGICSRDNVVGVFWPESDAARARNALRQSISFVRSCLGQDALVGIGAHGLSVNPSLACDANLFEDLLDDGKREEALELYAGELLPGFHVTGSIEFSRWLDGRRAQLAARAAKAAWDLSAEREAERDSSGAAFWGKRALSLSPFSESEVQRLLRLLQRLGDCGGALRAFHGLSRSLEAEFGVEPSRETVELANEIRRQFESASGDRSALGARRFGLDRRIAQRRRSNLPFDGPDRRKLPDRRKAERRSGIDRRAPP